MALRIITKGPNRYQMAYSVQLTTKQNKAVIFVSLLVRLLIFTAVLVFIFLHAFKKVFDFLCAIFGIFALVARIRSFLHIFCVLNFQAQGFACAIL